MQTESFIHCHWDEVEQISPPRPSKIRQAKPEPPGTFTCKQCGKEHLILHDPTDGRRHNARQKFCNETCRKTFYGLSTDERRCANPACNIPLKGHTGKTCGPECYRIIHPHKRHIRLNGEPSKLIDPVPHLKCTPIELEWIEEALSRMMGLEAEVQLVFAEASRYRGVRSSYEQVCRQIGEKVDGKYGTTRTLGRQRK